VQLDPVAPERSLRFEQPRADRAGELFRRPPTRGADLASVDRGELLGLGARREDVRAPVDHPAVAAEGRLRADKEALELDVDPELLHRLPLYAGLEPFARPHAASGRAPHAFRIRRFLDQREAPARVEDEERDVVAALG